MGRNYFFFYTFYVTFHVREKKEISRGINFISLFFNFMIRVIKKHTHTHTLDIHHMYYYIYCRIMWHLIYNASLSINSNTKSVISRAHSAPPGGGATAILCFSSLVSALHVSYRFGASWLAHVLIGRMSNANPNPNRPHLRISSFNL